MAKIKYKTISILLTCNNLPDPDEQPIVGDAGAVLIRRLGIQHGKIVLQDRSLNRVAETDEMVFEAVVETRGLNPPDFGGGFVHGRLGERFLYLSWGDRDAATDEWLLAARTKISLTGITDDEVLAALKTNRSLGVTVTLTDTKGRLRTGSVPQNELLWHIGEATET